MEVASTTYNFSLGDIVKFVNPYLIKRPEARLPTRQGIKLLHTYSIRGISSNIPYARTLVKKKFVYAPYGPLFQLFLLDNYKPELLGRGYRLLVRDATAIKLRKVGKIIDVRDYPENLRRTVSTDLCDEEIPVHDQYKRHGFSSIDNIAHSRTLKILPFHENMAFRTAIYALKGKECPHCGELLFSGSVQMRMLEADSLPRIEELGEKSFGCRVRAAFPVSYKCINCGMSIYLVDTRQGNESFGFIPFAMYDDG